MKSQIGTLALVAALAATPAYAAWTDTAPAKNLASAWEQVKVTVTTKVNEWVNYWTGEPATAPANVAATAPTVNAPATAPVQPQVTGAVVKPAVSAPVTPAPMSPAAMALRNQPLYMNKAPGSTLQDIQKVQGQVKNASLMKIVQPGRVGTSNLPRSKAGVPVSNFARLILKKGKKIPQLDIGTENLISREDFSIGNLHWEVQQPTDLKKLPQPAPVAESEIRPFTVKVNKAPGPRGLLANNRSLAHPVTMESVAKIKYTIRDLKEISEMPYKPLSEEQMKMVAALLLFEKGKHCPMVMGLFHQLAAVDKMRTEAMFHLGSCAKELKMNQATFDNLSKVMASEDKDYASRAVTILAKDLKC